VTASALGAAGTWADFDDSARSEEISVDSFEFVETQDIKIASPVRDGGCPTDPSAYVDSREAFSPIELEYNRDGSVDGVSYQEALSTDICVRNAGRDTVTVALFTDVLVDDDPYCSGDEDTVPGETCGITFGDQQVPPGELDDAYTITLSAFDLGGDGSVECSAVADGATVSDLRDGAIRTLEVLRSGDCAPGDILRRGEIASVHLSLAYDPGFGGRDAVAVARLAQSDHVTFQYVLGASAL